MTLEQQLQLIIDEGEENDVPPVVLERAIAPVLKLFAEQLQQLEYFILQNLAEELVLTTIANPQSRSGKVKRVIYAFVSVGDAAKFRDKNSDLVAMPVPLVQLLFRLIALERVDSLIFLEDSTNLNLGVEIERDRLSQLIQERIIQLKQTPTDIA